MSWAFWEACRIRNSNVAHRCSFARCPTLMALKMMVKCQFLERLHRLAETTLFCRSYFLAPWCLPGRHSCRPSIVENTAFFLVAKQQECMHAHTEKYFQEFGPRFLDMSYCQKGSHLQRGWISVVRRVFTGGVIIMKSRVYNFCIFALVVQWLLFIRFGALAAITRIKCIQ